MAASLGTSVSKVTLSAGSTINWASVTNQNLTSNPAYSLASTANANAATAKSAADDAYDEASAAWSRANKAYQDRCTDQNVFDVLTSGGTKFGIFSDSYSGRLYINADYIRSGTINADYIDLSCDYGGFCKGHGSDGQHTTYGAMMYGSNGPGWEPYIKRCIQLHRFVLLKLPYHDTWRLLKKYRDVTWSLELSIRQVKNQFRIDYDCNIKDFLESIYMAGADLGGTDIENHARCIERSYKMLTLLENSVNLLRTHHQSGEVYYWILYYSFLSPQKLKNVEEIIEALRPHIRDISFSTYYRLRKAAVEALSSVLWGFSAQDTLKTLDCFFPPDV